MCWNLRLSKRLWKGKINTEEESVEEEICKTPRLVASEMCRTFLFKKLELEMVLNCGSVNITRWSFIVFFRVVTRFIITFALIYARCWYTNPKPFISKTFQEGEKRLCSDENRFTDLLTSETRALAACLFILRELKSLPVQHSGHENDCITSPTRCSSFFSVELFLSAKPQPAII